MSVPIIATEAERALVALFEARAPDFGEAPLDRSRTPAFQRFAQAGLPHRRVEAFKYTDLKARLRTLPPVAGDARDDDVVARLAAHPPLAANAARIVMANGRFCAAHSAVPEGARLASILAPDAPLEGVGALVADSDDPLTLANIGLFEGGAVLHIDRALQTPIEIIHIVDDNVLVMGRLAIFVAADSAASLVERTLGGAGAVTNQLAEIDIAAGGALHFARLAEGADATGTSLSTQHIRLDAGARLEHLTVSTGLGLVRNQTFCHVIGDDAEANFRAATVAIGARHTDNTLVMRHSALGSRSSEVFRSAVGEHGISIVQGRIIVDQGAQKTDARMMSNALFLDDTGEVVNKPELEIFADDVQCGHGATSGDLDEDPVFYLRARGIPEAAARQLLVEAFLIEALDRVEDDGLREAMARRLRAAIGCAEETQ